MGESPTQGWGPFCLPGTEGKVRLAPTGTLDFLGSPAHLIVVVHADGHEEEPAGQEQQDAQGYQARLSQRGGDHCGRGRGP